VSFFCPIFLGRLKARASASKASGCFIGGNTTVCCCSGGKESRRREAAGRRNWPEAVPEKMSGRKRGKLPNSIGVGKRTRTTGSDSGSGSKSERHLDVVHLSLSPDDKSRFERHRTVNLVYRLGERAASARLCRATVTSRARSAHSFPSFLHDERNKKQRRNRVRQRLPKNCVGQ
jgi:hypothetical protein